MLRSLLTICLLVAGATLVVYGLYLAWPPLAYVAAGALLLAFSLTREAGAKA